MMRSPNQRSRKSTRSYRKATGSGKGWWRWIVAVLLVFLAVVFFTGNKSLLKLYSLHQDAAKLEKQKQELIQENQRLSDEIQKLKKDDKYIEKVAREKFNMKKKDEDVYIIEKKP